ncbi:MAG TPA: hypothetical protein PKE43_11035 [Anaerolineales bacterium]|nr:hypothetical protein [Anaerolineales bacterium]HNE69675.1 hypothetical protein [Anaerolineales bacterium]
MFQLLNHRMLFAWMLSVITSYFVVGFFGNYYPSFVGVLVLAVIAQTLLGVLIDRLFAKAERLYSSNKGDLFLALALFMVLTVFAAAMLQMANQFPSLFDAKFVLLEQDQTFPFIIAGVLTIPLLALAGQFMGQSRFSAFVDSIATGVLVASFFFAVYFIFSFIFNQPVFDTDDIFFDSDGWLWRTRFTTDAYEDYYWRSLHPFVLLVIRPLVFLVSLFLKGDRLSAGLLLMPLAGAACVFMAWYFVKKVTGNSLYAVLIAALLGGTTGHLIFGFLIETYIFIAAVAMLSIILLLRDAPLFTLIITGLVSFGITLSNIIQPTIALVFVRRDLKQWIKYGLIVGALAFPLTLLNNVIYPDSQPYFFDPSSYGTEGRNTFEMHPARAVAIGRVMFLNSIVAPDPLILKRELPFLKVWIVEVSRKLYPQEANPMRSSEYETQFGTAMVVFWMALAALGGFGFLKNIKKQDNRFAYAFIFITLFSFVLHQKFGKELFLYATNWTYAIVLFLALGWREFMGRRWFQAVMLVFIALMLVNNSRLILTMLSTSALHIR